MDIETLPPFVGQVLGYLEIGKDMALEWALSPAAWSQFAVLVASYLLAMAFTKWARPRLNRLISPADEAEGYIPNIRRFVLAFTPLLLPIAAFAFTAAGEQAIRSIFASGEVIAFGKRIFLFIAARIFVRDILRDPFLRLLGKYILLPMAALYAIGLLDTVIGVLDGAGFSAGALSISALDILRAIVFGSVLFWLGSWSNKQSSDYIKQQDMRPSLRELSAKAVEFLIFGLAFILLMSLLGIPLTSLAVLTGAIGVGLGFGLQKIASNFISGVILLLEGQATVGDYVELDGGEQGQIVKMTARACILETFDGRWIVVPNEDFIVTRVINFSDSGSANRYEAPFSVTYETDINLVPAIVEAAVSAHPKILDAPYPPDCELRGFGESGVDFACEFWVNGLDDGDNKFTSDVLFLIWNALKDNGIEMPYPRRVIEFRGETPPALSKT
ncbi:mechanosensitive ion channel family protein [Nereida sp. MMG025]|uniref:mechanosensitive ion channel family protein n=1 Tax=Nereida sp. MMG025 TaxID=2909981 RepID=UPI001F0272CA|nr:mechanosensitive ion channel domain-containing protein [Nereida sp. MMG025]MCF6444773.1 mechanosensitive ion channel [Nereida sp. MMG025]